MAPGLADKGESKTRRRTKMISAILAALKTAILELVPPSTGWMGGTELDLRFAQDGESHVQIVQDGESHEKDFL